MNQVIDFPKKYVPNLRMAWPIVDGIKDISQIYPPVDIFLHGRTFYGRQPKPSENHTGSYIVVGFELENGRSYVRLFAIGNERHDYSVFQELVNSSAMAGTRLAEDSDRKGATKMYTGRVKTQFLGGGDLAYDPELKSLVFKTKKAVPRPGTEDNYTSTHGKTPENLMEKYLSSYYGNERVTQLAYLADLTNNRIVNGIRTGNLTKQEIDSLLREREQYVESHKVLGSLEIIIENDGALVLPASEDWLGRFWQQEKAA